jgi:hypothetical protein
MAEASGFPRRSFMKWLIVLALSVTGLTAGVIVSVDSSTMPGETVLEYGIPPLPIPEISLPAVTTSSGWSGGFESGAGQLEVPAFYPIGPIASPEPNAFWPTLIGLLALACYRLRRS